MGGIREAYTAMVARYLVALDAWDGSLAVREAAMTLGMGQQQYCDGYVALNFGPLVWTSAGSSPSLDFDGAYREAVVRHAERVRGGRDEGDE